MDFSGTGAPTTASPASPAPSRERSGVGPGSLGCGSPTMPSERRVLRCAVYTRKSSEHGLEQDFNSLDAQREAGEAYIKSQSHEGWRSTASTRPICCSAGTTTDGESTS